MCSKTACNKWHITIIKHLAFGGINEQQNRKPLAGSCHNEYEDLQRQDSPECAAVRLNTCTQTRRHIHTKHTQQRFSRTHARGGRQRHICWMGDASNIQLSCKRCADMLSSCLQICALISTETCTPQIQPFYLHSANCG